VDTGNHRFWVQDETGGIAVDSIPAGIAPGQVVRVAARTLMQDTLADGSPGVRTTDFQVTPTKQRSVLPAPKLIGMRNLARTDMTGLRVQLTGIVQSLTKDSSGAAVMTLGDSANEVQAFLPPGCDGDPINSTVQITGVGEAIRDGNGYIKTQRIWIAWASDVRIVGDPPASNPQFSVRSLYLDPKASDGHQLILRGRVAVQKSTQALVVEDAWGALLTNFDQPTRLAGGTPVEVRGFLHGSGIAIEINHATAKKLEGPSPIVPEKYAGQPITSTAAIHDLKPDQANAALPVRLTAVVTFVDTDWKLLYVQDPTGGIFLTYSDTAKPLFAGERVTVVGLTNAGNYAPIIVAPKFIEAGTARLPEPIKITARDASSGMLDSDFVEVEGVVHPLKSGQDPRHLSFDLFTSFGQIHVSSPPGFGTIEQLRAMEDATVRVRGVCGTIFNSRRQLIGFQLSISKLDDIKVVEAPDKAPFDKAPVAINDLLRFSPHARFNHRVKVAGSVTMVGAGFFYIEDKTGGLEIQGQTQGLRPADFVEAVGYATPGGYSPVLTEAQTHVLRHDVASAAQPVTAESLVAGKYDSRLVTTEGRLLSVMSSPGARTLVLQSGSHTFNAQLYVRDAGVSPSALELGSVLRLTGISSSQVDPQSLFTLNVYDPGFRIMIRSPQDIQVLKRASWWNVQHTALVLGALLAAVLATLIWGAKLRQRVRSQTVALRQAREKAQAVRDLTTAMQEVSLRKDFTARVSVQRGEEIAQLGAEFNKMLAELHARDLAKAEAEARLQHQALTDELTGLPNRRLLSDRLSQALAVATRNAQIVGVLYIDLDGFKLVNDSLGHTIGDALLGQVAERLGLRIRKADTLSRLGGDEFTVVLTKLHTKEEAELVAKNLLDILSTPFLIDKHNITISASVGISMFPENGVNAADLLQQADSAMYSAKRNGKNRYMYFTPELGSMVRERVTLENQLHGAIVRGEITVQYQSQFDVNSGQLVGFEALARWTHPTLGSVPPAKFIPIAEESGLIVPLGAFVLQRACTEAAGWQKISAHPIQVAVNVSSIQFTRTTFVDEVAEVLRHAGLKPELLQIELTESVMLNGTERAAETMKRLRKLGVTIAIDDFGTGYSCLSHLPRLPFNTLKIDRAFVKELTSRKEMKAMVQSLITLATQLNMEVVVEGIETPEQLAMIKTLGANQVQGFLFGRSAANPTQLLTERTSMESSSRAPDEPTAKAATV
jgi:diguanylate cyclase (GGDEF)-like protein